MKKYPRALSRYSLVLLAVVLSSACIFSRDFSSFSDDFGNNKYLIYVNKSEKTLYVVDNSLKTIKTYTVTTGAQEGNKMRDGDSCTPEGKYNITQVLAAVKTGYLKDMEKRAASLSGKAKGYRYMKTALDKTEAEYKKNRKTLAIMNGVYFKAATGHKKYGTNEDLGNNVYGAAFLRLSYPNEADIKRNRDAIAKGLVPKGRKGKYEGPGTGIAIHGTNDEAAIGHSASTGCVRMRNRDITELLGYAAKSMTVIIER